MRSLFDSFFAAARRMGGVIESGFGSLNTFNMLVSGLFDQSAMRSTVRWGSSKHPSSVISGSTGLETMSSFLRHGSNLDSSFARGHKGPFSRQFRQSGSTFDFSFTRTRERSERASRLSAANV
jgi:hypothetical protein